MRGWWRRPSRPSPAPAATSPGPARPATSRTPRSCQRGRPSSGRGSSPAPSVTRSRTGMTLMTAWRRLIMTRTTAGWREILKPLRLSRENNRSVECPVSGGVSCSMLSSEQGTLLSVLELHWRPDAGLHQPRRGVEAVHTEAAGRGKLPSQLSWRLGDLLLQGLHCKWVKHTANCTAWTCAVLNDLLFSSLSMNLPAMRFWAGREDPPPWKVLPKKSTVSVIRQPSLWSTTSCRTSTGRCPAPSCEIVADMQQINILLDATRGQAKYQEGDTSRLSQLILRRLFWGLKTFRFCELLFSEWQRKAASKSKGPENE